nr:hypothetical protein B0A51_04454 [Rachicladosporium sp. CCFEE 5018]
MKLLALFSSVALALALPADLEKRQYIASNTQNQLTDGTPCRAITVIFARGTFESGNVGTIVGPPFFQALANSTGAGKIAVQGVAYPADVAGFNMGGDAGGSRNMANLAAQAQSQCPKTKLVLSGYSQGAQLVHNAAALISNSTTNFVSSVVVFGDPDRGQPVGRIPASKVKTFCNVGDNICDGGNLILPPHLTYATDAPAAAAFVRSKAGI